ncbi:MAG: RHS repeat-associated core domain-containing protein, partial [Clostridiaceae bacterium]|nr:RHS repeat-associated core domain-containing protein [Clostridiaceae bacterium]
NRTIDQTTTLYYLYNGHADVTVLIDGSGAVQGTYYYDAFGNILERTGNADNNITYAGYQYDK